MKTLALFLTLAAILFWVWWQMFGKLLHEARIYRKRVWAEMQAWDEIVRNFNRESK